MKISRDVKTAGCMLIAFLGFLFLIAHYQATTDIEVLNHALNGQIDCHSGRIASILTAMDHTNTSSIHDAIYDELQKGPESTSLILRSDIKVEKSPDGRFECIVDTSRYGIAPRAIFQNLSL